VALQVFTSARAALETVRGTSLTPTRLIYGEEFAIEQTVETIRPTELRASYNPVYSASAGPERNAFRMSGRMSYDDLIWHASLFFKGGVSPTGAGADRTWTFLPTAASDDLKTATVQLGYVDTIGASAPGVEVNYVFGDTFNLHFEKNNDGALTFASTFLAAKASTQISAFTGALSDRAVVLASCNNTTAFIDTTTIGTTGDANVISLDFNLSQSPVPLYTLDGTTAARAVYRPTHRRWSSTIVRQFANDTEWDKYVDKTPRKVRLRTTGPVLGGSNYKIDLDLYGVYTNRTWTDVDGIITETLTLEQIYDATATADHQLVVVNAATAIT
jgi:hypothetical protein